MEKSSLEAKGWTEKEIEKAAEILEHVRPHEVFFSRMVFWSALVVIIFANLLVSLVLIPFLIVLNQGVLYALIIILAGTIGFLYNFLITDIGHLERKHHFLASILVPAIALANMVIMVLVANRFIADLQVANTPHNPWMLAVLFAGAFLLPTLWKWAAPRKESSVHQ